MQPISHATSTFTKTIHSLPKLPWFLLINNRNKKMIFSEVLEISLQEPRLGKLRTCLVTYGFVFIFIFHFSFFILIFSSQILYSFFVSNSFSVWHHFLTSFCFSQIPLFSNKTICHCHPLETVDTTSKINQNQNPPEPLSQSNTQPRSPLRKL